MQRQMILCSSTGWSIDKSNGTRADWDSILSTPLTALKKRGFNVDRLLNQEREDRLRLRAEQEERQSVQRANNEKQSLPPRNTDADSLVSSDVSTATNSTVKDKRSPSILDHIGKKNPFINGGGSRETLLSKITDQMPGAFNQKLTSARGSSNPPAKPASSQSGQVGPGHGPATGNAPGHTTKEVSVDTSMGPDNVADFTAQHQR
jgi:hypothetical protein